MSGARFNIYDAKAQLSALVKRAQAGERIVISIRGKPAAVLGPMTPMDAAMEVHYVPIKQPEPEGPGLTAADVLRAASTD